MTHQESPFPHQDDDDISDEQLHTMLDIMKARQDMMRTSHADQEKDETEDRGEVDWRSGADDATLMPHLQQPQQASEPEWCLWHADKLGERRLYTYPKDSQLASDGCGGLWILCETAAAADSADDIGDIGEAVQCCLWHATASEEQKMYSYPKGSRLVGDGLGGAWVLCRSTEEVNEDADWVLRHATPEADRALFSYPAASRLVGDGCGGVWILCETADEAASGEASSAEDWCLWHAEPTGEEQCLHKYPKNSKMASDGQGGLWILCETTESGDDATWSLWHATVRGERNLYSYPKEAKLAT